MDLRGTDKTGVRRRVVAALVALGVVVSLTATPSNGSDTNEWFKAGVPHSYTFADPSLAAFGPMTWAYATNTGGTDLPAMWSADNTRYTARTEGLGADALVDDPGGYGNDAFPNVPWGINNDNCNAALPGCDPKEMWAPSVGFVGSHWVSYHAVRVQPVSSGLPFGRFCIYVATSSSPLGPFRSASSSPIVCPSASTDPAGAVDPDVFVDEETGKAYLTWMNQGNMFGRLQRIYSRQLNSTGTGFASGSTSRQLLINNAGSWEGTTIENPSMTYVNGAYVLLYSGNKWDSTNYATGYAVCSGPNGPCTRPSAYPLMATGSGMWGPGGADGMVDQRGRFIAMYHAWNRANLSGARRVPHTAELKVTGTGLDARVSVTRHDIDGGAGADSLWSYRAGLSVVKTPKSITGTYIPAAGDFNGDSFEDIYWYGTWDRADARWNGTATTGTFTSATGAQAGSLLPVPGDFNGDGRDDLYWYQPGGDPKVATQSLSGGNYEPNARRDQFWTAQPNGSFAVTNFAFDAAAIPLPGDFDGDGDTDIIWFAPGSAPDTLWRFTNGVPVASSLNIVGNYRPVVGDFDGNGTDDLFWYGPGAKADYIWWYSPGGAYTSVPTTVTKKDYRPFSADVDADGADELFWYTPGGGPDYIWPRTNRNGTHSSANVSVSAVATPVVGDYDHNGFDDILWYS